MTAPTYKPGDPVWYYPSVGGPGFAAIVASEPHACGPATTVVKLRDLPPEYAAHGCHPPTRVTLAAAAVDALRPRDPTDERHVAGMPAPRIPIAVARRLAEAHGMDQVIVLAFSRSDGKTHVVTYGRSISDCEQAAEGGNKLKRVMGWPEDQCNDKPARTRRKQS